MMGDHPATSGQKLPLSGRESGENSGRSLIPRGMR